MTPAATRPEPCIRAVYHLSRAADADAAEGLAHDIALEQTVEVPIGVARAVEAAGALVGEVGAIEPHPALGYTASIDYRAKLAADQLPQLLNLLFGNISLKPGIRLIDLRLPDALLEGFTGPRFGVAGLRELVGVHGRPLLATALKPRGADDARLAEIAEAFARGGGDLVKDDHNLVDATLDDFKRRIDRCQSAVERAAAQTGRRCLYAPNVCVRGDELDAHLRAVSERGIAGVLLSPMLLGLDAVRFAAERHGLFVLAHPTFAGTFFHDPGHGIAPELLLGTLFRLAGVDGSIYPNFGGRFTFTRDDCTRIAQRLREPIGSLAPALPAPAGGMKFENIPDMAGQYGPDAIFLVGGALLADERPLEDATAALLEAIRKPFDERLTAPAQPTASACEMSTGDAAPAAPLTHLPFNDDFTWRGRAASPYKSAEKQAELPFKDVARHELVGPFGESTAFDLRYFEVAPGGYTSCEKHQHTHTLIAVRGRGVLALDGDERCELKPFDVAYVEPMRVHQLRNESADEPFGFFCLVDHQRDRPAPP